MINKKGNIPITIFVLGVVMVCILVILSFMASSFYFKQSFYGVSAMEELNSQIDEYYFYLNQNMPVQKINSFFKVSDNHLVFQENSSPLFPWKKPELLFSVQYSLPHR